MFVAAFVHFDALSNCKELIDDGSWAWDGYGMHGNVIVDFDANNSVSIYYTDTSKWEAISIYADWHCGDGVVTIKLDKTDVKGRIVEVDTNVKWTIIFESSSFELFSNRTLEPFSY